MILLAYLPFGHPDWDEAEIRIFAAFPREEVEEQRARLLDLIATGRLAISEKNLRVIATDDRTNFEALVEAVSSSADLVIFGFTAQRLGEKGAELFRRHPSLSYIPRRPGCWRSGARPCRGDPATRNRPPSIFSASRTCARGADGGGSRFTSGPCANVFGAV